MALRDVSIGSMQKRVVLDDWFLTNGGGVGIAAVLM
jgi:hypothetical protein